MARPKKQIITSGVYERAGMLRVDITLKDDKRRLITVGPWTPAAAVNWSERRKTINQQIEFGVFRWADHFTAKQWGVANAGVEGGSTFGDCVKLVIQEMEAGKPQSMETNRSRMKRWSHLDNRRVASLRPNDLKTAFVKGGAHEQAPNTQRAVISCCRKVLEFARENGVFKQDLELYLSLRDKLASMAPSRPKVKKHAVEGADMELVLSTIKDNYLPVYGDWFEFMFFSGLRPSEARELRWKDVSLAEGFVVVSRAKYGHFDVSTPKTEAGVRPVRLLPRARAALERRLEASGGPGIGGESLVFRNPSTDGHMDYHRDSSGVSVVWYEALEMAGLPKVRPYVTRHTYATNLYNAGVPARLAASQLGHASTDVFHEVYARFIHQPADWDQLDEAAKRMGQARSNDVPFSSPVSGHSP